MARIHDLRSFMEVLQENGRLATVEKEVNLVHEIGSVISTLESESGKAAHFTNVAGTDFSVAGGMLASMDNIALALGVDKSEITDHLAKVICDNPFHNFRLNIVNVFLFFYELLNSHCFAFNRLISHGSLTPFLTRYDGF